MDPMRGRDPVKKGDSAERRFAKDFKRMFPNTSYEFATNEENMNEHWDLRLRRPERMDLLVDVKSIRGEQDDGRSLYTWLELLNVNGGYGALLGLANTIVIEDKDCWVMVDRKRLLIFTISNIREVGTKGYYSLWSRKDRQDKVVKIPMTDIYQLASFIIQKME